MISQLNDHEVHLDLARVESTAVVLIDQFAAMDTIDHSMVTLSPNPRIDNRDLKFVNLYIIASTIKTITIKNSGKCKTDDRLNYCIKEIMIKYGKKSKFSYIRHYK